MTDEQFKKLKQWLIERAEYHEMQWGQAIGIENKAFNTGAVEAFRQVVIYLTRIDELKIDN